MDPVVLFFLAVPVAFAVVALKKDARPSPRPLSRGEELRSQGFKREGEQWVKRVDQIELVLTVTPERGQLGDQVEVVAQLLSPIATELEVTPTDGRIPSDAEVGYDFDLRFRVKSPRADRAAKLLRSGTAQEMVAADVVGLNVSLDQEHVRVVGRWITNFPQVNGVQRAALGIARRLIAGELRLPELIPWPEVSRTWARVASELGASFDDEARLLTLESPSGVLRAHVRTEREERWFAELGADLGRPLPVELTLSDEGARSLWQRWTEKELEIDDAAFDAAFFIVCPDADAARALLGGDDLRRTLVELERRTGTLVVTRTRIEARFDGAAVVDGERLAVTLRATLSALEALADATAPRGETAYR